MLDGFCLVKSRTESSWSQERIILKLKISLKWKNTGKLQGVGILEKNGHGTSHTHRKYLILNI